MKQRNTIRILIASCLLMLSTGSLLVKSAHCVLVPHDVSVAIQSDRTIISQNETDSCPICAFDFFPVVLHPLQILNNFSNYSYSELICKPVIAPAAPETHLFLLRAPPAVC